MFKQSLILATAMLTSVGAMAGPYTPPEYMVTVTNITKGQSFTPILSATHKPYIDLYEVGEMASPELIDIAESGNIMSLKSELENGHGVRDIAATEGLLSAGNTVSYSIKGSSRMRFSLVAMLIPSNDTFVGLDAVHLPRYGAKTYFAYAYDAGSETNDEVCANIPGPVCGGVGLSPDDHGEGYIYSSPGIHGEADVSAKMYDFQGAVAKVTITRVK